MSDELEKSLLHLVWTITNDGYFIPALPSAVEVKIKQSELYRISEKHNISPSVVIGG